jgi:hypothetical protein
LIDPLILFGLIKTQFLQDNAARQAFKILNSSHPKKKEKDRPGITFSLNKKKNQMTHPTMKTGEYSEENDFQVIIYEI